MKKNYKISCAFIMLVILQCIPYLGDGQITFQKIYPASINQEGTDIATTSDGGYIIVGTTETSIANDLDIQITKTDNLGNLQWTKTYGGNRPEYPNRILPVSGGNYLVIGYSQSFGGGDQDMYLLKINSSGDTLWTKVYGGYGNEDGKEITATADGKFVIVGASNSISFSDNNVELMKIDTDGTILWTKYYGGPNYESARSVDLCSDGGFIIAGKTAATSTSVSDLYIVRTNSAGDTLWTKTYGGPDSYEGKSIVANTDGTYTLCVDDSSAARDSDVRLMKISATGAVVWNKVYGGTDKDICKMIKPTNDGNYIVAGISRSFGWVNPDMWLLKINPSCDTLWSRHYGGSGHEHCYAARQTADRGYIAVGHSKSYSVNTETMFVKVDSMGRMVPLGVDELVLNNTMLNIYPNPTEGVTHIDLSDAISPGSTFRISNSLGQVVFSEIIDQANGTQNKVVDLKNSQPGVYFVTVQSAYGTATKKLILN